MTRIKDALASVWAWLAKFEFHDYLMTGAATAMGIGVGLNFGPGWGFMGVGALLFAFAFPPIVIGRGE